MNYKSTLNLKEVRSRTIFYLQNNNNEIEQPNKNFIPFKKERGRLGMLLNSVKINQNFTTP